MSITHEDLNDQLASIAAARRARIDTLAAALPDDRRAAIRQTALDQGAQHFVTLLDQGVDEPAAQARAVDEAQRHEAHLLRTARQHADPAIGKIALRCAACGTVAPHALEVDGAGETVATCACGRGQKFARGLTPAGETEAR